MEININKKNLLKLATYLSSGELKADFNMLYFSENCNPAKINSWRGIGRVDCGTVGCALGHGPYAGIPKKRNESWLDYSQRVFGISSSRLFTFIFGGKWAETKYNGPADAAARIKYVLNEGRCPEEFDMIERSFQFENIQKIVLEKLKNENLL